METVEFRVALDADLYDVVRLLVDDNLGSGRETLTRPLSQVYENAFKAMRSQNGNDLIVAVMGSRIVGCYQLTIIHGISRGGVSRAQIEGVRVDQDVRGQGPGTQTHA